MKQQITVDQLQEFTQEQKERLREWWKPEDGDAFIADYKYAVPWDKIKRRMHIMANVYSVKRNGDIEADGDEYAGHEVIKKQYCLPLLSIGQLIELIDEKSNIGIALSAIETLYVNGKDFTEICDALWEAVKAVL